MKKRNLFNIVVLLYALFFVVSCSLNTKKDGKSVADHSGRKIIETGDLSAIDTRSFVLPRFGNYWYQMKIIGILKHGSIVKAGDSIIRLDPSEIKKFIIDKESDLETQVAVIQKLKVTQENRQQELNSNLRNEIASFDLTKLELESSRFESERIRKIKGLEFKQAEITLAKTKRLAVLNKKIAFNELKIELIKEKQLKDAIKEAYAMLPNLTIRTPISGIFQIGINRRNGEMIKLGDDIYQGSNMGNVPNLTWMKANTTISENDFIRIRMGQKAVVRLDAMPKVSFKGEVIFIGKLCHLKDDKSRQKVFDVEIKILTSDERLKPGMTVSCEFI
jgi:multidrug efflux pump subunit AcrA (membrane-fusion protein)